MNCSLLRRRVPRWCRFALLGGSGAGAMALMSVLTAAFAFGAGDTVLVMGASGLPVPPPLYVEVLSDLYVPGCPSACNPQPLFTPEGLYPVTGVRSLLFDMSAAQGAAILNNAIKQQLADGNDVTVVGLSQSSTVASLEMQDILSGNSGISAHADQLSFVLLGDPSNPNGGVLERFDLPVGTNPSIGSFGITASGATPVTEYPTLIYTGEYDGFADFPRYPLDFPADLNAVLGIAFVHSEYGFLTPDQIDNAEVVPTSAGYDGATTYYMIPTEDLPLLDPMRLMPGVGPIMADLMQPDLEVLVNLGYGDPNYGWVNADANVPTPIGLFPSLGDFEKVPGLLAAGTQQGIHDAIRDIQSDLQNPAQIFSLERNPILPILIATQTSFPLTALSENGYLPIVTPPPTLLGIANAISGAESAGYSAVLPTVDFANALTITLPAYDTTIFLSELAEGDVLDAVGLPIAADVGIMPGVVGFEFAAVELASVTATVELISPFVDVASLVP